MPQRLESLLAGAHLSCFQTCQVYFKAYMLHTLQELPLPKRTRLVHVLQSIEAWLVLRLSRQLNYFCQHQGQNIRY